MKMKFDRTKILYALRQNREKHLVIVLEAQKGFREKLISELGRKIVDLKEGKKVNPNSKHYVPESHVDDYDRAIQMLEMCTDQIIELDESAFRSYVRNQWGWGGRFLEANSPYSASAAVELGK